jgi:predicted nucleic acid-binding Zn finger protein
MYLNANIYLAVEASFESLTQDVQANGPAQSKKSEIWSGSLTNYFELTGVDYHLLSLHHLLGKNFSNALKIVDDGGVSNFTATDSGRTMFMVRGKSEQYTVFPEHYCSCQAFFYEVCQGHAMYCKHQLAAQMASILKKSNSVRVSDEELAVMLINNVVPRVSQ